ncbi:MAG: hypothetical protein EOP48_01705 [Sphingobacteriales bacterium]|nr:MAG: hypothetical protein EOP48_01705 [Sphingobacteriales bacterium]
MRTILKKLPLMMLSPLRFSLTSETRVIQQVISRNFQIEADAAQLDELKLIENDTLSREALKSIVSLADLLAAPETYHNQYVCVKGYLNLEFEGDALYRHKSDYSNHAYKNSCWVEFSDSLLRKKRAQNYSKRYVVVEGIFDATRQGHMSLSSGEIRHITALHTLQRSAR